jgi:hypothetical protein
MYYSINPKHNASRLAFLVRVSLCEQFIHVRDYSDEYTIVKDSSFVLGPPKIPQPYLQLLNIPNNLFLHPSA